MGDSLSHPTLGIVAPGGGLRGAFVAGALEALVDHFGVTHPKMVFGCSGSAAPFAYYVSGQYQVGYEVYKHLSQSKLVNLSRVLEGHSVSLSKLFDFNILREAFESKYPLDVNAVQSSPTQLVVGLTQYGSGKSVYLSDWNKYPLVDALLASKAMPIVHSGKVTVGDEIFTDGELACPLEQNIEWMLTQGVDKVLVLDCGSKLTYLRRLLVGLHSYRSQIPPSLGLTLREYISRKNDFVDDPNVLYIDPIRHLEAGTFSRSWKDIEATYHTGEDSVLLHRGIKEFLEE